MVGIRVGAVADRRGRVGDEDAGPTNTPCDVVGIEDGELVTTMSPLAGVLPAMSRMALAPVPRSVS